MTTIGDILDEFFSPLSSERLWIMPESDDYTAIIRQWQPVVEVLGLIKRRFVVNSVHWGANYLTNPGWRPTKTNAPKTGAHPEFVRSPVGTDPTTCMNAFIIYVTSKIANGAISPAGRAVQTRNLYTCSIGSFSVYMTLDKFDGLAETATLNYWMYNAMSKGSFGRFAHHPAFLLSRMATQYMWWNWRESLEWSGGTTRTVRGTLSAAGQRRW